MKEYPKIHTIFNRNPNDNFKSLMEGHYSLPEFEYLKDNEWVFTEKVDGTNIRVIFDKASVKFGGKTDNAQIPSQLGNKLNDIFIPLMPILSEMFDADVCLYGEGYGAKIQKGGGNYRQDQSFVLFDIEIAGWWLQRKDVEDIATKLGLDIVPIIGSGTLSDLVEKTRTGFNSLWGNFLAEGIVARPQAELRTRKGDRLITKIKHKDFKA